MATRLFKFACPVCGQHIQSDSDSAGSVLECPTCFRKLTVPQAPSSDSSKFILTASIAGERRVPVPAASLPEPVAAPWKVLPVILGVACVLVAAALLLVLWRDRLPGRVPQGSHVPPPASNAQPTTLVSRPDTSGMWTLNLTGRTIPATNAVGRLNGWEFVVRRALWQGTTLTLRQGGPSPTTMEFVVPVPLAAGERLTAGTFQVASNSPPAPTPLQLRWRDEANKQHVRSFTQGYALRIELASVNPETVAGRIYLCVPDAQRSWVAGGFEAKVKKVR